MPEITVLKRGPLTIADYRCRQGASDPPFTEYHGVASVSYVRAGTFGYHSRGRSFELVAGCVLVGNTGDEFVCSHDHRGGGDECLSFQLAPDLVEALGDRTACWQRGALPPLPELMVLGELCQASVAGETDIGLDEAALSFVTRFIHLSSGRERPPLDARAALRRRVVETALWIDENCADDIDLASAAGQAGLSAYHFLRLFSRVLGVTPHQYLVRSRLRRAARLLGAGAPSITRVALDVGFGDLSNFVRTFRRAAGVSPRRFQALAGSRPRGGAPRASRRGVRR
jgi:AraC family transcriptional regulator